MIFWFGLALAVIGTVVVGWLLEFIPGPSIRIGEAAGFWTVILAALVAVAGVVLMIYAGLR